MRCSTDPAVRGRALAALAIARELDAQVLRIDLSRVVSKYIGETEKNLAAVFAEAEQSGAVLLFDEADALFGKRSDVRDSHDRYANVEASYLLQRIEALDGLAILTTNTRQNIDEGFVRRLRFVVEFRRRSSGLQCPLIDLARPDGFEPPTTAFEAQYSIQLSYGRARLKQEAVRLKPDPQETKSRAEARPTGIRSPLARGAIVLCPPRKVSGSVRLLSGARERTSGERLHPCAIARFPRQKHKSARRSNLGTRRAIQLRKGRSDRSPGNEGETVMSTRSSTSLVVLGLLCSLLPLTAIQADAPSTAAASSSGVTADRARRALRDPVAAREFERLPAYRSGARPMITPLHSDSSSKVKVMPMRDTSAQDRPIDPAPGARSAAATSSSAPAPARCCC